MLYKGDSKITSHLEVLLVVLCRSYTSTKKIAGLLYTMCTWTLNLSAWEYQSTALGYNYHTARQSGACYCAISRYH